MRVWLCVCVAHRLQCMSCLQRRLQQLVPRHTRRPAVCLCRRPNTGPCRQHQLQRLVEECCVRACVWVCECLRSYFSEDQFGATWVADLEREEHFFFFLFALPHIFADLLKRNFQGQNLVLVLGLNLGLVWFRIRLCSGGEGWGLGEGLGNAFCQWMSSQK